MCVKSFDDLKKHVEKLLKHKNSHFKGVLVKCVTFRMNQTLQKLRKMEKFLKTHKNNISVTLRELPYHFPVFASLKKGISM